METQKGFKVSKNIMLRNCVGESTLAKCLDFHEAEIFIPFAENIIDVVQSGR